MEPGDLTDDEMLFAANAEGGIFHNLNRMLGDPALSAQEEAAEAALRVVVGVETAYPSRTERMLVYATLAAAATKARDDLLEAVLRTRICWTNTESNGWCGSGWSPFQLDQLSRVTGLAPTTVRARYKRLIQITLDEAQKAESA